MPNFLVRRSRNGNDHNFVNIASSDFIFGLNTLKLDRKKSRIPSLKGNKVMAVNLVTSSSQPERGKFVNCKCYY